MSDAPRVRRERWWVGLLAATAIVAANAAYVASSVGFLHPPDAVQETDHLRYIEMAKGAGNTPWRGLAYEPPFCYRVLTPLLVSQLMRAGLALDPAFYALTHLFLVLFLFALYLHLTSFGLPQRWCLLGLALVGLLQGADRWYSYQYWMTDPLALFLVTLGLLLVRTQRHAALLLVSVVGVTARESYLLVFPYLFLRTLRREGLARALERTLAIALAPLVVLVLLRSSAAVLQGPGFVRLLRFFVVWRFERLFDNQLYLCTIGSFGVLLPLLLLLPRRLAERWRGHWEEAAVLAIVYGSLLLANNTDRLLAYALPVVLPVALLQLQTLVDAARVPFALAAGAALAAQAVLYQQTLFDAWRAVSVSQPASLPAAAAILAFWVGATALAWRAGLVGPVGAPR